MIVLVISVIVVVVIVSLLGAFFRSGVGAECARFGLAALQALLRALGASNDVDDLASAVLAAIGAGAVFLVISTTFAQSEANLVESVV